MKSNKKTAIKLLSILVVVFLILTTFFVLTNLTEEEKTNDDKPPEEIVDDRINPLSNQGLILEIKRVRNRNLLDKIMSFGTSWRKKPNFYVVTNIDDGVYSSYKETGFIYESWDTIGNEFRVIRDVEEEQKTSKITISIFEKEKKGIFRTKDVEKENIDLIFDYKTGRWTGSDNFHDDDGYGHLLGENYEIWFDIYQTDFDQDGIPYWVEVNILKTDPQVDDSNLDSDNDGISNSWEWKWGYDPHVWDDHYNLDPDLDGIENIEEYMMQKWFADPFRQDIYVEVDNMKKSGLFDKNHILFDESAQIVIERFCRHNINLYIDYGWPGEPFNGGGQLLESFDDPISWNSGIISSYYKHHFPDERKEIFRYVLLCKNSRPYGFCGNTEFNRFDTIVISTKKSTTLFKWRAFTPKTERTMLAAVLLHEIGHSLGIGPNTIAGCDNNSYKNRFLPTKARQKYLQEWGNYKSVMNYYYLFDKNLVDLSDGTHGDNDQNDWKKIYLPFFQTEVDVVVDPFYHPITKEGIDKNVTVKINGWNYSQKLTERFIENISDWSPVSPIRCNWIVYIKNNDEYPSERNIRIYAKPIVPFSVWSLSAEGFLDSNNNIILV